MNPFLWLGIGSGLITFVIAYLFWTTIRAHRLRADLREIEADLVDAAGEVELLGDRKIEEAIEALDCLASNAGEFSFSIWLFAVLNANDEVDNPSAEWPEPLKKSYLTARSRAADRLYVAATRESLSGLIISCVCYVFYGWVVRPWLKQRAWANGIVSRSAAEVERFHLKPSPC